MVLNPLGLTSILFSSILPHRDTSLELDFDALDDEDDELSESGEHKTSSLSGGSPSPPLPSGSSRGLTDSGTSYSNIDTQPSLDFVGSRDNLSAHPTNQSGGEGGRKSGVTGVSGSKDSAPMSPTGGVSLSLGSLDIDFDFPSSFGLGTISEGRSLMNIPTTISDTSRYEDSSSTATSSGQTSSQKAGTGGLQRSVSQQPLQPPSVSDKGRNNTYQPQKKPAPQTAPKPRRGASVNQGPPPTIFSSLQRNGQLPPLSRPMAQPAISKIGRQSSESSSERISPQQARKEMMKSTPALFPSPPRSRRNTDSLPRPSNSRVMTPLLPFQAQQELREAALRAKQESSSGKKSSNGGVIPHMTPGSPILIRKGGSSKQSSPPLSAYRSTTGGGNNKHSPIHGQRNSPTSSRLYPAHLSPGGMKGSSSMTRLAPSSSYSSSTSRGTQEETTSTMSRNSSMDSGIQYISEGETGGGATTGERASNTSTTTTDSIATTTSLTSAGSGVKEPVGRNEDTATTKKKVETGGLGDFSDVLSVLSNW